MVLLRNFLERRDCCYLRQLIRRRIDAGLGELSPDPPFLARLRKRERPALFDRKIYVDETRDGRAKSKVLASTVMLDTQHARLGAAGFDEQVQAIAV